MRLAFSAENMAAALSVREYDWIEVWDCDLLHSDRLYELGCVFRLNPY